VRAPLRATHDDLIALVRAGRVRFWGSDCGACGNTTPDTMRCSQCKRDDTTTALYEVTAS
jgi:uncharacterized OB-fold protein